VPFLDIRKGVATIVAAVGPELDQDYLAPEVAQCHRIGVDPFPGRKIGCCLANPALA